MNPETLEEARRRLRRAGLQVPAAALAGVLTFGGIAAAFPDYAAAAPPKSSSAQNPDENAAKRFLAWYKQMYLRFGVAFENAMDRPGLRELAEYGKKGMTGWNPELLSPDGAFETITEKWPEVRQSVEEALTKTTKRRYLDKEVKNAEEQAKAIRNARDRADDPDTRSEAAAELERARELKNRATEALTTYDRQRAAAKQFREWAKQARTKEDRDRWRKAAEAADAKANAAVKKYKQYKARTTGKTSTGKKGTTGKSGTVSTDTTRKTVAGKKGTTGRSGTGSTDATGKTGIEKKGTTGRSGTGSTDSTGKTGTGKKATTGRSGTGATHTTGKTGIQKKGTTGRAVSPSTDTAGKTGEAKTGSKNTTGRTGSTGSADTSSTGRSTSSGSSRSVRFLKGFGLLGAFFGNDPMAGLRAELALREAKTKESVETLKQYMTAHPREAGELADRLKQRELPLNDPERMRGFLAEWDKGHDDKTGRSTRTQCDIIAELGGSCAAPQPKSKPMTKAEQKRQAKNRDAQIADRKEAAKRETAQAKKAEAARQAKNRDAQIADRKETAKRETAQAKKAEQQQAKNRDAVIADKKASSTSKPRTKAQQAAINKQEKLAA